MKRLGKQRVSRETGMLRKLAVSCGTTAHLPFCGGSDKIRVMSHASQTQKVPDFDNCLSVPWLSALHVISWIVITAVIISINVAVDLTTCHPMSKAGPWTTQTVHVLNAAVLGAVLVAAGILILHLRSTTNRLQPGHWLIMNSAVLGLLSLLLAPLWRCGETTCAASNSTMAILFGGILCVLSATIYWSSAKQLPKTERWVGVFRSFVVAYLLLAVVSICLTFHTSTIGWINLLFLFALLPVGVASLCATYCFLAAI